MSTTAITLARRTIETPIGVLELVASPVGLRAVLWPGEDGSRVPRSVAEPVGSFAARPRAGAADAPDLDPAPDLAQAHLDRAAAQLAEYFDGARTTFDVALDPAGTQFQRRAWDVLSRIPFGQTISYRAQAAALGDPAKARAVGAANGRNPISIIVPCHRVVASSGALTGFAGGMDTKAWLLEHERRVLFSWSESARI
ncbi:MAG: methylated-DNA--[protein]-cysteine S-methyltransferase [Candidatus Nanopelagicales bacterium]